MDTTSSIIAAYYHERPRKSSAPPTSYRSSARTSTSSTSTGSSVQRRSTRLSDGSGFSSAPPSRRTSETSVPLTYIREGDEHSHYSSSSSSGVSVLHPLTPVGGEIDLSTQIWSSDRECFEPSRFSTKPASRSAARVSSLTSMSDKASSIRLPPKKSGSSISVSSLTASVGSHATHRTAQQSVTGPPRSPLPRPLRLPQESNSKSTPASGLDMMGAGRPRAGKPSSLARVQRARTVSTPSTSHSGSSLNMSLTAPPQPAVPSVAATTPTTASSTSSDRLKPRIGTGMAYRTGSTPRPSLLRVPSSSALRTAATTGTTRG